MLATVACFLAVLCVFAYNVQRDATSSEIGTAGGYISTAPGFANEKKVDHAGLIVEVC
jgi:hypothetical protein